jgi:hypothetical protein
MQNGSGGKLASRRSGVISIASFCFPLGDYNRKFVLEE